MDGLTTVTREKQVLREASKRGLELEGGRGRPYMLREKETRTIVFGGGDEGQPTATLEEVENYFKK